MNYSDLVLVVLDILVLVGLFLTWLAKSFLPAYATEKGKNLATKEDVSEITALVERVKAEHATETEKLKSELLVRSRVQQVAFEREFQVLSEVWSALADLRIATQKLRPPLDFIDPTKEADTIKQERLNEFNEKYSALGRLTLRNRPFYHEDVYKSLVQVLEATRAESLGYQYGKSDSVAYWQEAVKSTEEIIVAIDVVCEQIRKRVVA